MQVVCVLKGLLEDGEILLSGVQGQARAQRSVLRAPIADGRRFVSNRSPAYQLCASLKSEGFVPGAALRRHTSSPCLSERARGRAVHKDFRVIALANPPGYPFLGNDFFAEMGDVFSCHCVDNPVRALCAQPLRQLHRWL
jgi:hypothetical protein